MKRRREHILLLVVFLASFTPLAWAQDIASFEKRITLKTLDNGLTILVCERPEAPVFSFFTHVDVGSDREVPGITGLAHMFEHMAFKGTDSIGTTNYAEEKVALEKMEQAYYAYDQERSKEVGRNQKKLAELEMAWKNAMETAQKYVVENQFGQIVEQNGSQGLNAFTNNDETGYHYSFPANQLKLWAYLESERFLHPVLREFYKERDVVHEERRLSESDPFGRLFEQFLATAYVAHPYGQPVVGWPSDLESFSMTDAENFYRTYYVPANMVVTLALGGRWLGLWSASLDPNTVLVLPLEVRGQPDGGDFAGQAFAETLALNLAQIPSLRVLPVPAAGQLRSGGLLQGSEDARRLRAGRLVHGSLTRAGDRLHATLGLVDTSEGARMLWGVQKEASPEMLSALAVDVAKELGSALGAPARKQYEFFYYDMGSPEMAASPELSEAMGAVARGGDTDLGLRSTKRLIERFPEEPQACVLRAMALLSDAIVDPTPAKIKAFQESLVAVDRVDPENPWDEVFSALYLLNAGSYAESVQGLSKILTREDLAPSAVANVLALRGTAEAALGNFVSALADLEKSVRLDPAADVNFYFLSRGLFLAGRKEEALVRARQAVALNASAYDNLRNLGLTQAALGRWPDAVISLRKACELARGQFECALYALSLIKAGDPATAREMVDKASAMAENRWGTYVLAAYHALTSKRAESVRLLKRSVELGTPLSIPDEPELAYLRTEPLFDSIVAEVKLSEKRKR